jgi:hypothetical protein
MENADELHPMAIVASRDVFPNVKQAIADPDIKKRMLNAFTEYVKLAQSNNCVTLTDYKDVSKDVVDCILEHPKVIIERHFTDEHEPKIKELEELGELRLPFPKITIISGEYINPSELDRGDAKVFSKPSSDGSVNLIHVSFLVQHADYIAVHVLFCKRHEIGRRYYAATLLLYIDENGKFGATQPVLSNMSITEEELTSVLADVAYNALTAIHTMTVSGGNVYISTPTPDEVAVNKKRISKGKKPLIEFRMITVDGRKSELSSTPHGTHASPRLHWRRGHWRTMKKSGKKVWVDPMLVGDEKNGKIIKDYAVGKYEEQKHVHH